MDQERKIVIMYKKARELYLKQTGVEIPTKVKKKQRCRVCLGSRKVFMGFVDCYNCEGTGEKIYTYDRTNWKAYSLWLEGQIFDRDRGWVK